MTVSMLFMLALFAPYLPSWPSVQNMRLQRLSDATCDDLVTFSGRFYAIFLNGDVFAFDPHFLELTPLKPLELLNCCSCNSLVPSGDDELFLVEKIIPPNGANMSEPPSEKKASLSLSSSSSMVPDWTQLPEELLHIITEKLEHCFNVIHARSVCTSWRSTFPFPHSLLRPSYSLPAFGDFPYVSKGLCTLEKVPLFLFRVQTPAASPSEYFLGGVGRDECVDHMELQYPIQFSVKIPGSEPTVLNIRNSQVFPLGHQYRIMGWDPESWTTKFKGVAFLPLNEEGEFVVLLNYTMDLLVLRSSEMRWMRLKETSNAQCRQLVAFKGRFYAAFINGDFFIFDPYTLKRTPFTPLPLLRSSKYLVQAGDDELLLVEKFNPFPDAEILDFNRFTCRVSRLDNEADKWVEITDLGDRVLFIRDSGNFCCSAKELPDGCGVSGNSIVFTNTGYMTFAYKYGVHTGKEDDELNIWRFSRENRVTILNTSPMVAFKVEPETSVYNMLQLVYFKYFEYFWLFIFVCFIYINDTLHFIKKTSHHISTLI
ncbi:unnamed protein product [Brassica napus]|uniref:(rape) hypothetical protein n=1 Tax=Brassica napus TaxID=3708 RepID=A0A817AV46_BRANA|nr:unnamed protein product [Brassica napus]